MDSNGHILELFKEKIIFEKYQITKIIEKTKNLQIYEGKNIVSDELIIIKIEQKKDKKKKGILEKESYYLNYLKSQGIPSIQKIGYFRNNIISIQSLLGLSLTQLFIKNFGKLKLKDIALISIQLLERIKYIHSKNIIHCDICPNNFVLGVGRFQNIIYMTHFNSAKSYIDKNTLEHIKIKYKASNKFTGNYIFASVNALRGLELSRRDDLESLGYILIYFLKGSLPWEHSKSLNISEQIRKIYQIKKNYNLSILCDGVPEEFKLFLNYVKSLSFQEEPDYNYCFSLFYGIFKKINILNDGIFSWNQEKKKVNQNFINQFYNKLWFNKYFNNNTSTMSIGRESIENIINIEKGIKKSNSCLLFTHNLTKYILNVSEKIYKRINNKNINNYEKINDNIKLKNNNKEQLIKIDLDNPKIYLRNSENKSNISMSLEKEYSIEGKIDQEAEKVKTYEKKSIGINITKSFNKAKKNNTNNKIELIQNELKKIKNRINNKRQRERKESINHKKYLNSVNKTFSKKEINNKYLFFQKDIIYSDYLKKSIPYIKSGNSSTKNNYFKNKIKYFRNIDKKNKDNTELTSFSHKNRINSFGINKCNITNINFKAITNSNNDIKENKNLFEERNNSKKKQKKIISLNLENLILNTHRLNNTSNQSSIKHNNVNSSQYINKILNSYQNSLNNLSKKSIDMNKHEKIRVIKKNMTKEIKTINNKNIKPKKLNIYEHKSLLNKHQNINEYKKHSCVLNDFSNKYFYASSINNKKFNKKTNEKTFKKILLYQTKNSNSYKKRFIFSTNKNKERNKRLFCSISSSYGKNTLDYIENEINNNELGINKVEQNKYSKIRKNNNTIFSNFNKINNRNYIYTKTNKMNNKTIEKPKEIIKKYVKISNSPIIHNSISKLNLIQNVSNIYVTKSYLEEKPLTDRKNKVLTYKTNKNKNIYIKPKNKISYDLSLLNKENITNLLLELNNKNIKDENFGDNKRESDTQNYYFSELNIFK